jgi:hypothetical protein
VPRQADESLHTILLMTRRNHRLLTYLLALLLTCSLLVAQWAGLQHRVAHASLPSAIPAYAAADSSMQENSDNHLFHSCILLDANAVGACLAGADYMPALQNNLSLPILILPLVSWQALFTRQFSSRAPPFLNPV